MQRYDCVYRNSNVSRETLKNKIIFVGIAIYKNRLTK